MTGETLTLHTVTTPEGFEEALALRYEVFCDEQQVPREIERDAEDDLALHVVVRDAGGRVCGTGRALRMRPDGTQVALGDFPVAGDVVRVGRMAVRRDLRGRGVGALMLRALEEAAVEAGLAQALLHAQCHAQAFYARLGYVPVGERFEEAGIAHVTMTRRL